MAGCHRLGFVSFIIVDSEMEPKAHIALDPSEITLSASSINVV